MEDFVYARASYVFPKAVQNPSPVRVMDGLLYGPLP